MYFLKYLWYFPKNDKRVGSVSRVVGYELETHVLTPVVSGIVSVTMLKP
jgi:hypothetical protein